MLTIEKKISIIKGSPSPENIYYFFLCTDVADIPQYDLNYFFDLVVGSVSFFEKFSKTDSPSNNAETKLKTILLELHIRMEIEHVPNLQEPGAMLLHDKPKWDGLNLLWEVSENVIKDTSRLNLTDISHNEGLPEQTISQTEQSHTDDIKDKLKNAEHLILMSQSARKSGELLTCEQRLKNAINILADLNDINSLIVKGKALQLLANLFSEVRRFAEAEQIYLEAREHYEKLNLPKEVSFILHGLGNLYNYRGQPEQAISYYKESLLIKEGLSSSADDMRPTLYGLGLCYMQLKMLDKAMEVIHQYEAMIDNDNDQFLEELRINLFAYQDDWASVIKKLEALLSRSEEKLSSRMHLMVEMSLTRAYNEFKEYDIAEKHFWNAFSVAEESLHKWLSSSTREGLRKALLTGIEQQFQIWRTRSEFDVTLNYKILNVVERLSAIELQSRFGTASIAVEIGDTTLETLSEGELILYLFGTDVALYTFFLDKDGIVLADSAPYGEYSQFDMLPEPDYLPNDPSELDDNYKDCFNTVMVTALMLFLIQKDVNKICLLFPFGKGNNIPWDFFISNAHKFSKESRPEIFKTVPICRLPSFSVCRTLKEIEIQVGTGPPAVFVDPVGRFTPLTETRKEAETIKKFFNDAKLFAGRNANMDNLQKTIRPSFLHISCHGSFNSLQPLDSCLKLSMNNLSTRDENEWREWQTALLQYLKQNPLAKENDYDKRTPSLYDGDFKADLFRLLKLEGTEFVLLSACSGAKVAEYDEIQGFAQSVFLAGCPNLIAPLWDVNVEAALAFVQEFYKEYRTLTDLNIFQVGKLAKCVVLARNTLIEKGYSNREAFAWTVFGLG